MARKIKRAGAPDPRAIALARYEAGDYGGAYQAALEALRARPNDAEALFLHGMACAQINELAEGARSLETYMQQMPGNPDACRTLGSFYRLLDRPEDALGLYDAFLERLPGSPSILASRATQLMALARVDEAGDSLRVAIESAPEDPTVAVAWTEYCKRTGEPGRAIPVVRSALETKRSRPAALVPVRYALGELLDRAGEYDEAFEAYTAANSVIQTRHDRGAHSLAIKQMIAAWSPDVFRRLPRLEQWPTDAPRPVFVCGMPRSGTSLLEQILASHPRCYGGGELDTLAQEVARIEAPLAPMTRHLLLHPQLLTPRTLGHIQHTYADALRQADAGAAVVVDKMPGNALFLPLIAAIVPDARIVYCTRDPRDIALSCYFQHFTALSYASDLRDIGAMIADERAVVRHCIDVLGITVLEMGYETVVEDVETATHALVEHAGLSWDEACLRFWETRRDARTVSAAQVHRPIYASSVGRWKNYERHIGPLLETIPPAMLEDYD